MATVGVDLGGTKVMAAVVHHGRPHHPGKVPTPTDGPDAVVEAIATLIEETAEANDRGAGRFPGQRCATMRRTEFRPTRDHRFPMPEPAMMIAKATMPRTSGATRR